MHLSMKKIFLLLIIGWVAVSCAPFEPEKRTMLVEDLPLTYSNLGKETGHIQRWWEDFDDPELNDLIELALGGNLTLKEGWARLRQARAQTAKTGASLFPSLSAQIGTSAGRQRIVNGTEKTEGTQQFSAGLVSTYELDLFGKLRAEKQAKNLFESATREEINTIAITLAASVTESWISIISQRMQKKLLNKQLEANLTVLDLIELRFRNSLASALDVLQQRQIVERSRAQIPLIEQNESLFENELAVLLGSFPHLMPDFTRETLEIPLAIPEPGIPAQLLSERPDIRAAMLRLQTADWNVAAARADRLPSINLSASAISQSDKIDLLIDNWLLRLAADVTAPLYDGNCRKAEVERTKAVVEENLAAYRRTVLNAIVEVENALVSEEKIRRHLKALEVQFLAAQNALREARSRYLKGLNDYLPVITELLTVQNLQRDLIVRRADILIARVSLYRALGGTWTKNLTE